MKTLNRIYIFMLFAAMTAIPTSCVNNWLEEDPYDGIPADDALKTSGDLETALIGVYKAFKGTSGFTDYYAATMLVCGDVRGEDVQYNNVYGSNRAAFYYYMNFSTGSQFTFSNTVWQSPYIVISRANRIIEAVRDGKIEDAEEAADKIKKCVAEAKVLRAYALFDLTRIYGMPFTADQGASLGVPIMLETVEYNAKPERSTVAQCYEAVLADLEEVIGAETLTKDVNPGFLNHWAAEALLTRVYLTMGNNEKALATAENIISHSPYQLWTPDQYATAWSKTSASHLNEIMFELGITGSADWTDRNGIAYLYKEAGGTVPGYGDIVVTESFYKEMISDSADCRNNILLAPENDTKGIFGDAKPYLNKYQNGGADVRYANIPLLRLSEVYLSAAEAAFNLGNTDKAAQYLNDLIKNRSTDESKQITAATITADRIYLERRKELVGEGQRFFDAMRRGETITRYQDENNRGWHDVLPVESRSYDRNYYKALSAIPQAEINANPNIKQNPGYGN